VSTERNLKQLLAYACVGLAAFAFEYVVFLVLTIPCKVHYVLSHTIARILSAILHFFLSRHFIFKPHSGLLAEGAKYAAAVLLVLTTTAALLYALVECTGMSPVLAKPLAGLLMFFVSFITLKLVVFTGRNGSARQ
jgi:putative flippase GtrA